MDQSTKDRRDKLFCLAFSSSHDGEILNAVRKLKDLGVTEMSLQATQQKSAGTYDEKAIRTLIEANSALRIGVLDRDRLIQKLGNEIHNHREDGAKREKTISSLEVNS
jgi:hypothetical protein